MPYDPVKLASAKNSGKRGFDPAKLAAEKEISTSELVKSDLADAALAVRPLLDPLGSVQEYARDPRTVRAFAAGLQNQPLPEGQDFPRKAAYYAAATGPETAASLAFPFAMGAPAAAGARILKRGLSRGIGAAEEAIGTPEGERLFTDRPTIGGTLAEGAGVGALQGAAGGALKLGAAAYQGAAPVVGQLIRATAGTKVGYAEAFAKYPSIIQRAIGAAGQGYEAFERYTGLQGIGAQVANRLKPFGFDELYAMAAGTAKKVLANRNNMGPAPTPQEMYEAGQAANALIRSMEGAGGAGVNDAAKLGLAQGIYGSIKQSKDLLDDALESVYPEYGSLRRQYFAERVAEEMGAVLPKNANQSPNVLRSLGAGYNAASALNEGDLVRAAGSSLVSPLVWRTGLQAAYGAARALPVLSPAVAALEGPGAMRSLRQSYERRRLRPAP